MRCVSSEGYSTNLIEKDHLPDGLSHGSNLAGNWAGSSFDRGGSDSQDLEAGMAK